MKVLSYIPYKKLDSQIYLLTLYFMNFSIFTSFFKFIIAQKWEKKLKQGLVVEQLQPLHNRKYYQKLNYYLR